MIGGCSPLGDPPMIGGCSRLGEPGVTARALPVSILPPFRGGSSTVALCATGHPLPPALGGQVTSSGCRCSGIAGTCGCSPRTSSRRDTTPPTIDGRQGLRGVPLRLLA
jgi:hypothetical protein